MLVTHAATLYLRNYRTSSTVIFTLPSKGKRISTADNALSLLFSRVVMLLFALSSLSSSLYLAGGSFSPPLDEVTC